MKKISICAFLVLLSLAAFAQNPDEAIVITWQTENGNWDAVGPGGALLMGWDTEDDVIDLVTRDSDKEIVMQLRADGPTVNGPYRLYGNQGVTYHVYFLGRERESYETNVVEHVRRSALFAW